MKLKSILIDEKLHQKLKMHCVKNKVTMVEVITEAINNVLIPGSFTVPAQKIVWEDNKPKSVEVEVRVEPLAGKCEAPGGCKLMGRKYYVDYFDDGGLVSKKTYLCATHHKKTEESQNVEKIVLIK